jgi:cyclase
MILPRVIPCLLIDNRKLIKTQKFSNPGYIGDPINAVKIFNELEVDELILLDISASKKGLTPDLDHLKDIVGEAFMPIGYGGGINDIEVASKIINIGIEKLIINTNALTSFALIEKISKKFGNQSVVLSIDIKKNLFGEFKIYNHVLKKSIDENIETYIKSSVNAGVGEIFLNFVDYDGMMCGYNYRLINKVTQFSNVPMIACGGAQEFGDFKKAIDAGASAVSAGSIFVYNGKHKAVLIDYPNYETIKMIFNE